MSIPINDAVVPSTAKRRSDRSGAPDTRLRGRRLILARVVWVAVALLALALFIASLPTYFTYLHIIVKHHADVFGQLTPNDVHSLQAVGLSLDFYAWFNIFVSLFFLFVYVSVGVVIFWRKSNDRMALLASISLVLFPVAFHPEIVGTLPPAWTLPSQGVAFLGDACIGLFLYLFPTGRFVPRWTRWLAVGWVAYWVPLNFFPNSPFSNSWLGFVSFLGLIASMIVLQVYRYRRVSSPIERQQTKWVVFGIALAFGSFVIGSTVLYILVPLLFSVSRLFSVIGQTLFSLLFLLFPLSIGFAILRYRLYDIDIIIYRTLVYSTLTIVLAVIYEVSVFTLQSFTSGLVLVRGNQLTIVASTLLIGFLFKPLHDRIRVQIDRRFYRRKYDAARTIATFSTTIRDEMDLNQLCTRLLAVVEETMQPAHVSLWLCPPKRSSEKTTRALPIIDTVGQS